PRTSLVPIGSPRPATSAIPLCFARFARDWQGHFSRRYSWPGPMSSMRAVVRPSQLRALPPKGGAQEGGRGPRDQVNYPGDFQGILVPARRDSEPVPVFEARVANSPGGWRGSRTRQSSGAQGLREFWRLIAAPFEAYSNQESPRASSPWRPAASRPRARGGRP